MAKVSEIDGYKEATRLLKKLDNVTQKKVVLSILRKASRPIIVAAKANVSGTSKRVAKSIRFAQIKSAKKIAGSIKPRGKDAWFSHFIEFGTSGIVTKPGGYKRESDNPAFGWVGNVQRGKKYREDQPAKPYMRPAISANKGKTEALISKGLKEDIDKTITKFKKK